MSSRCKARSFYVGGTKTHVAYALLPEPGPAPRTIKRVRVVPGKAYNGEINVQELASRYNELMATGWDGTVLVPGPRQANPVAASQLSTFERKEYGGLGVITNKELARVAQGTTRTFDPDAIFGHRGQHQHLKDSLAGTPSFTHSDNLGAFTAAIQAVDDTAAPTLTRIDTDSSLAALRRYEDTAIFGEALSQLRGYELAVANFNDNPAAMAQRTLVYEWAYAAKETAAVFVGLLDQATQITDQLAQTDPGSEVRQILTQNLTAVLAQADEAKATITDLNLRITTATTDATRAAALAKAAARADQDAAARAAKDDARIVAAAKVEADALTGASTSALADTDITESATLAGIFDSTSTWADDVINQASAEIASRA